MKEYNIGLSSWIIQDGNYDDFQVNDISEFAVMFYCENVQVSEKTAKEVEYISGCKYSFCGKVVYIKGKVWIIDIGILVFNERQKPEGCKVGSYVEGTANLSIDYYIYFESLANEKNMLPLIYTWLIDGISLDTTPFILSEENGRECYVRDCKNVEIRNVQKTDAYNEGVNASYFLKCKLEEKKPKYISSTVKLY